MGYTKVDGSLVLQNGNIIEDLTTIDFGVDSDNCLISNSEDTSSKAVNYSRLCIECDQETATRECEQCEDVFCEGCYKRLHHSSHRESHTWKALGVLRCVECDRFQATRFCVICRDPYCLGCFTIIHFKGNKQEHNWIDCAERAKINAPLSASATIEEDTQTFNEFLQSNEYEYMSSG